MSNVLDRIYSPATRCVVRRQEEQYLIYNTETDELHLLSPIGFYLYSLCDGSSPLNELQEIFSAIARHETDALEIPVAEFFNRLSARGIVEFTG